MAGPGLSRAPLKEFGLCSEDFGETVEDFKAGRGLKLSEIGTL